MTGPSTGPDLTVPDLTSPDLTPPRLTTDIGVEHTARPSRATSDGARRGTADSAATGYLIRSEERLQVSTVPVRARRVRLEKYVVTETRTITVQVSREMVRLVDMDLDDDPTGAPTPTTTDGTADDVGRWLALHEERVAITTEVVPVERVRLAVYSVTEQQDVTDSVRREHVHLDPLLPTPSSHY